MKLWHSVEDLNGVSRGEPVILGSAVDEADAERQLRPWVSAFGVFEFHRSERMWVGKSESETHHYWLTD
jgi:hypothetical protein